MDDFYKNGQVERAFEVLDEMYKSNLPPNVVSFGSAISACGKVCGPMSMNELCDIDSVSYHYPCCLVVPPSLRWSCFSLVFVGYCILFLHPDHLFSRVGY